MKKEFYYLSSNNETNIHAIKWLPEKPIGIVQIAHGVTEHIDRYDEFANYLTSKGYIVVGNDHLGHGKSIIKNKSKMYFGPQGSWENVVKDIKILHEKTSSEHPNIPYYIIGFSLGSFLVRTYLIEHKPKLDKVVLIGTGTQPKWLINILKQIVKKEINNKGAENPTPLVTNLSFGTYNRQIKNAKTPHDWLTSNEKALEEYCSDPLVGKELSSSLFYELLSGISYTSEMKNMKQMPKIPVLLISGKSDPVGDMGKGIKKLSKKLNKLNISNQVILYENLRHDILHEKEYKKVYEDIYKFIA